MKKEKYDAILSWRKLNKNYEFQKKLNLLQTLTNLFLLLILIFLSTKSPLVITLKEDQKSFFYPTREEVKIHEKDLEAIALKFILARYSWKKLNEDLIIKGISPFITKNLESKVRKNLKKLVKGFPKGKRISQSITNLKTKVSMKKIIITFDQIIKIENLPLLTQIEVEFLMIKKSPNVLNPLGIYINNVTRYEKI